MRRRTSRAQTVAGLSNPYEGSKWTHCSVSSELLFHQRRVAERIGLGFELPCKNAVVGPHGPKIKSEPVLEMAASI